MKKEVWKVWWVLPGGIKHLNKYFATKFNIVYPPEN